MNYLAHLYVSAESPDAMLGSLLGDFVKGRLVDDGRYPLAVLHAVALHRRVDSFANGHPTFRRSVGRVAPGLRRYAGVLVDLFYDHFLARAWPSLVDEPLAAFSGRVYAVLAHHAQLLPVRMRPLAEAMSRDDWLVGYGRAENIDRALRGLARRRGAQPLTAGYVELMRNYAGFEADSREFLEALVTFTDGARERTGELITCA